MTERLSIEGDHVYRDTRLADLESMQVDATGAVWSLANMGPAINRYPLVLERGQDVHLLGGRIAGEVSLTMDWRDAYVNSAAVLLRDPIAVRVDGTVISGVWDGIRIAGPDIDTASDAFLIENVWMRNVRDDAVENDDGLGGTLRDSLFDGVFVGVSLTDRHMRDRSDATVALDGVMIRLESYLYRGELTHQSPFKMSQQSPALVIHDSILAIETVHHKGLRSLEIAWSKLSAASGNYFLNLSDTPLPGSYPIPPEGFEVLEGAAARAFWQTKAAQWLALRHDAVADTGATSAPPAGQYLQGDQTANALSGGPGHDRLHGGDGDDLLLGGPGFDVIKGGAGHDLMVGGPGIDMLIGGSGADTLSGGAGDDTFRLNRAADSAPAAPDTVMHPEGIGRTGGDLFDLRGVDADTTRPGNQPFVLGHDGKGGLIVVDADGYTEIRGNTDDDEAFELLILVDDGPITDALNYSAKDFAL